MVNLQQSASPSSLRLPPSILTSWDSYKNTGTPTWIFLRSADGLYMFRYITFLSNTCSKTGGGVIFPKPKLLYSMNISTLQISHYAGICNKRLERIGIGGRLGPKKPTLEDIDQSRLQIFRPSMFGGTLQETLNIQKDKFPARRLPWILTTLTEQIMGTSASSWEKLQIQRLSFTFSFLSISFEIKYFAN